MTEAEARKLRMQNEANSAAIQRLQMQVQSQSARRTADEEEEIEVDGQVAHSGTHQNNQQGQYQNVDPNQIMLQAITTHAANVATQQVQQNLAANSDVESKIKARMQRLASDYPALTQDDSPLVIKSREVYQRIAHENPALDEATRYELAVREAASYIGAIPVNAPVDVFASDYVMPAGRNPAMATKSNKSRLTPNIVKNAMAMGINVDANTPEGKKNLAELSEYSARFNADQDESQYRYK